MIERRRHRRIVTLKNFGWLTAALVLVFAVLSIDRSFRGEDGGYGRIMDQQIGRTAELKPKPQIVTEAKPVDDQAGADPLLLAPAAREQEFLSTSTQSPAPIAATAITPIETRGAGNGVAIVGGAGGVTIVRGGDAKRPVLAGGIFKQP